MEGLQPTAGEAKRAGRSCKAAYIGGSSSPASYDARADGLPSRPNPGPHSKAKPGSAALPEVVPPPEFSPPPGLGRMQAHSSLTGPIFQTRLPVATTLAYVRELDTLSLRVPKQAPQPSPRGMKAEDSACPPPPRRSGTSFGFWTVP